MTESYVVCTLSSDDLVVINVSDIEHPFVSGYYEDFQEKNTLSANDSLFAVEAFGTKLYRLDENGRPTFVDEHPLGGDFYVFDNDQLACASQFSSLRFFSFDNLSVDRPYYRELSNDWEMFKIYPNPFNSTTTITYSIPHLGNLSINLYDLQGRNISHEVLSISQAGRFSDVFDLSDYPTGVYILEMGFESVVKRQKLVLVR